MKESKYKVGDLVKAGVTLEDIYKITKVRFDDVGNPIYTAVNNLGHLFLRDCEIIEKLSVS